jgi:hypothetical protein
MDIVYAYRTWPLNWIELRYSLRSLINLEHDNVFIIWDKPDWATNIVHIPMKDDLWSKFENVRRKYRRMCLDTRISEDFVMMNDDFYILKPIEKLWYYIRWTLESVISTLKEKVWHTKFYKAMEGVYKMYPSWDCFSVHTPIIFNKKKLLKIMKKYWDTLTCKRSLYCNCYKIRWEKLKWWTDCKVWWNKSISVKYEQEFLSSNDDIISKWELTKFLNNRFPHKSIYEI